MMLGLENEGPVNFVELVFMFLGLIGAALTYNFLFSTISELINYTTVESINIDDYFDAINYIDLDLDQYNEVKNFFNKTRKSRD
jgi:hypothetical protein